MVVSDLLSVGAFRFSVQGAEETRTSAFTFPAKEELKHRAIADCYEYSRSKAVSEIIQR